MNLKTPLVEVIGWCGAAAILAAYGLLTFGVITSQTTLYHLLNLVGSVGIVLAASSKRDWPASGLNVAFCVIALIGLASALLR